MTGQIQNVAGIFGNYYAAGFVGLLTTAAVLFLGYRAIREDGPVRFLAAGSLLIYIIVFIPPFSTILMKMIGSSVYWRVFWLLPSAVILACAGTMLWELQKNAPRKTAAVILCIAAVVLSGRFLFTSGYYEARQNRYALPAGVVAVGDAINKDAETRGEDFLKRIIAPTEIAMYIRVYDGTITQAYGRDIIRNGNAHGPSYQMVNGENPDFKELAERVTKLRVRYVVLNAKNADKAAAEEDGLEEIYIDSSYVVYFNTFYE